jgi:enamine deaminase RidA (YjgF/YER057c/UK114 family)
MDVYEKLKQSGIVISNVEAPCGSFKLGKEFGSNLLYMSGTGPVDEMTLAGQIGKELTLEQGIQAARSVGISVISNIHAVIGDLNRIKNIVKVLGFINSAPGFTQQPTVLNGFSDLMIEIFGPEVGSHARSAIGASVLPFNIPVEVEVLIELKS